MIRIQDLGIKIGDIIIFGDQIVEMSIVGIHFSVTYLEKGLPDKVYKESVIHCKNKDVVFWNTKTEEVETVVNTSGDEFFRIARSRE